MTQIHNVEQLFADPAITVAHAQYNTAAVDLDRANSAAVDYYEQTCYYIKEARAAKQNLRSAEQRYFNGVSSILFPLSSEYDRPDHLDRLLSKMRSVGDKIEAAKEVRGNYRDAVRKVKEVRNRIGDDPSADHEPMVNEKIIMNMLRQNDINLPHFQAVGPMTVREQGQDIPEIQSVLLKFLSSKFRAYLHFPEPDKVTVLVLAANAQAAGHLLAAADELNRQTDGDDKYLPDNYPGSFVFTTTNLIEALTRLDVLLKQATNEANY